MNLVLAIVVVATATAGAIAAMLLVRRSAPDGSYFHDGDRAAGVFGVLATGFAVLLGFVVFLAFTSYDAARSGAETEALIANSGALSSRSSPRTSLLVLGLAVVVGLSLALLFSLAAPWRGPLVVSGHPLDDVVDDLESGYFT